MARSTDVGAPASGTAPPEADEPEISAPPVVRPRREAARRAADATPAVPVPAPAAAPETVTVTAETPAATSPAAAPSTSRLAQLLVPPDTGGPRVRVGVLWFLLVLAAATSGRQWTAALWAVVAALAGYQTVAAWQRSTIEQAIEQAIEQSIEQSADSDDPEVRPDPLATGGLFRLIAGLCAAAMPIAAAYGTGMAGLVLISAPLMVVLMYLALRQPIASAGPTVSAIVLPALASISVVLAVRVDLWAGLFIILAVSLYDAGAFLLGADATGRWEGPVAGMIGALGVTFTMATFQSPPFDRAGAWIAGVVIAVCCPLGQWLASAFLPSADSRAPALRRIDAYLVAGPAFLLVAWLYAA